MSRALDTALSDWCTSYVAAFSAYDVSGISAHWTFPSVILSGGRVLGFKSRERFDANTNGLLDFYRDQSVDSAERTLIASFPLGDAGASIRVADRMLDPDGNEIVSWQVAYTLARLEGGWRAVLAAADGEIAAWAARGTPLGSKNG